MRCWDMGEPPENGSNHQQQQTTEEQRPCDSPTTPAMGDRNVAEKLTGDRNPMCSSLSSSSASAHEENIWPQNMIKKCLLCTFLTSIRSEYIEHILDKHCLNKNFEAVTAQMPNAGSLNDGDWEHANDSNPGPSKKSMSKSGKRKGKVNRCKDCDFVAESKMEYWVHLRMHVTNGYDCPMCPFVTKYKHHMAHHWMSQHDTVKPYECTRCSYSCVSKSMLTSHMKTHSTIYQYNCGTCTYKTKFCNAIKKHLKDTGHHKGITLNADGTPNPSAVIDIYGTKRGPKQKASVERKDEPQVQNFDNTSNNNCQQQQLSLIEAVLTTSLSRAAIYATTASDTNGGNEMNQNNMSHDQSYFLSLPSTSTCDPASVFNSSRNTQHDDELDLSDEINIDLPQLKRCDYLLRNELYRLFQRKSTNEPSDELQLNEVQSDEPLDLRMPNANRDQTSHPQASVANSEQRLTGARKRKRKMLKVEHIGMVEHTNQNGTEPNEPSTPGGSGTQAPEEYRESHNETDINLNDVSFLCQYCEIRFRCKAMYAVHMGFHNYKDPFTCNICGTKYSGKLTFYVHLITAKH